MINLETSILGRKRTLGLVLTFGAACFAFAQEKNNVSGKIVDNNNHPIPYASVSFYNKTNPLIGDAALTDEKGNFSLRLNAGIYKLTIEAINFQTLVTDKSISGAANLGNIKLEAEEYADISKTNEIEGIVITAQPRQYRVELDKKTYSVDQDLTSKGGTLQDVLENVPSVSVDPDGSVSMRGNSNIKFLINGKPSSLLGIDDGANALQSIPADQIDRIEIITNPSSKFESAGTAGILNIILKKTKSVGFNGSVLGTLGYLPTTRLNTNLSWKKGSLVYYLNGGGGYSESENESSNNFSLKNIDPDAKNKTLIHSIQDGKGDTINENYNVNTGFVWDATEKTSFNLSGMLRNFHSTNDSETHYADKRIFKDETDPLYPLIPYTIVDGFSNRKSVGVTDNLSLQADAGVDHKFNANGHQISLSGSYQRSKSDGNTTINENESGGGFSENFIDQVTRNTSFVTKLDYELPIGEKSRFEAGARMDNNKNNYYYMVEEILNGGISTILDDYTSITIYKENITAFYTQFKSKFGEKLGYQLGLRGEITDVDLKFKKYTGSSSEVNKNYTEFFPSAYLSYDLAKNNQLLANYTRRIRRPRSFFLIPFMSYNDNRNVFSGNPDLNPSFVDSFELGYSLQKSKFLINPTLFYKRTTDDIKMYQERSVDDLTGNTIIKTMPINLSTQEHYGLEINSSYNPYKWWRIMANLEFYGYASHGKYKMMNYEGDGFSSRLRLSNTFKPTKTTSFQATAFYRGAEKSGDQERKDMYVVSLGASKTLWNGSGTLSFNIQDIFNTRAMKSTTITDEYTRDSRMQRSPRTFSVSLSYNFKQGEKVELKKAKKDINSNDAGGGED